MAPRPQVAGRWPSLGGATVRAVVTAAEIAAEQVAAVRDDPTLRLALMRSLYEAPQGRPELHRSYRRGALAFMGWQVGRGLLNSRSDQAPGSSWWRAVNERLLRDAAESRAHVLGHGGPLSSSSVAASVEFIRRPSGRAWYRAHNSTIVAAYLDHRDLADVECRAERFFINLVLIRVLYAHALLEAPHLALNWLAPVAPLLGDPRLGMTGIFMSLSQALPNRYPLDCGLESYIDDERGLGRLLDVGLIRPRLKSLYSWSAAELGLPGLVELIDGGVPAYVWDSADAKPWNPAPGNLARTTRRLLPPC
jgi:hypothetical protein